MPDRPDILAAVLAAVAFVVTEIYVIFVPGAIGPNGPSPALYLILTVLIFPYAAYWAFSIRHALAVPLYRRQAFGIGFIVLAVWAVLAVFVVVPTANTPLDTIEQFSAFYFFFIALFYWIDSSVLASRRSDPLRRDTLYWSKMRVLLWVAIIVTTAIPFLILGYAALASNQALTNQLNAGTFGGPVISVILFGIVFNFPVVIPICGLIYLPAIAMRAKWDRSLRRHFLWFVPPSVVMLFVFFGPSMGGGTSSADSIITPLSVVIMGYSLYRSAKALVPLNFVAPSNPG
jgi:hypothetical protein